VPTTRRSPEGEEAGRLARICRYPVKSLVGEELSSARIDLRGVAGDRLWSVRDPDGKMGSGKSTRRFRRMDGLLALAAGYDGATPVVTFPDVRRVRGDDEHIHDALTTHVGRPVTLGREQGVSHFDEGPVHLVTTAAIRHLEQSHGRAVDHRRLRANLLVDTGAMPGLVEDTWIGRRVAIGDELLLTIRGPMTRCVMVDLPQVGLDADGDLLGTMSRVNQARFGVVADVVRPGEVRLGDAARLVAGP